MYSNQQLGANPKWFKDIYNGTDNVGKIHVTGNQSVCNMQ